MDPDLLETFGLAITDSYSSACFSPCGKYRYDLWRRWAPGPYLLVIGLNPSTADAEVNDPTIRREIDYAKRWGFSALCKVNAFAWRDTDPEKMKKVPEPIGPENDRIILQHAREAGLILAAWGNDGKHLGRDQQLRRMIFGLHCLKITKEGQPQHPLYLSKTLTPFLLPMDDD